MKRITTAALAFLLVVSLTACSGNKKISTAGMIDVTFDGIMPRGYVVTAEINKEKLAAELEAAGLTFDESNSLINTFSVISTPSSELSNGDEVKLEVKYDKNLAERRKINFETPIETITVAGLQESINLTELYEIETFQITGLNPSLSDVFLYSKFEEQTMKFGLTEKETREISDTINISFPKIKDFSNGDVITGTITYDKELAAKFGLKFTAEDKVITVSGLK